MYENRIKKPMKIVYKRKEEIRKSNRQGEPDQSPP
jgi:hypothetical protein